MPSFRKNPCLTVTLPVIVLAFQLVIHFQISRATSIIDTSSLTPTQGVILPLTTTMGGLNPTGSSAGDFNGDGFQDIIIGIPGADSSGLTDNGVVYIIFGTAGGIPNIDINTIMTPSQGIKITGGLMMGALGYSVDNLGDINNDKIDDIIIGTANENKAYVIFGKKNGGLANIDLTTGLASSQGITIISPSSNLIGSKLVSSAGDFNGDGINDFMVAAPFAQSNKGAVYIIFGGGALQPSINIDNLNAQNGLMITGSTTGDRLGSALNVAGDINKDSITDIMIGTATNCPGSTNLCGMVVIIYGSRSSISSIQIDNLPLSRGLKIMGTSDSIIGTMGSICSPGDLNNDGIDDLAIGSISFSANATTHYSGIVYVIYGKAGGFTQNIDLSMSIDGFKVKGNLPVSNFGFSVAGADINGDGLADLVVSSPYASTSSKANAGAVYALFGNKNGFKDIDLANQGSEFPQVLQILGDVAGIRMGYSIRYAKDLNSDMADDILALGSTKAYIFYGNKCEDFIQCSSSSLSPVCYASKGCACGEFNLYFQEKDCVSRCSEGYYLNKPICELCPAPCSSCTSSSTCQTCKQGFVLKEGSCEPACPTGYHLEASICQSDDISSLAEIQTINSITDVTSVMNSVSLTSASVIAPHDPGSVTASMLAKMLQYIRYINIPYSKRLELTFKYHNSTYGPFGIGPKMSLDLLLEIPFHPVPFRFYKYHVHSSFLVNFWDSMIFLAIIFGVLCLFALIEWSVAKIQQKPLPYPIIRTVRAALQNFCLMQFYNVLGDVLLFLVLDMKSVEFVNSKASISFCLSILFLFIGLLILGRHIYILTRFYTLRRKPSWTSKVQELSKQYEGSDVLFKHFKDDTFASQSFLLLFVIRSCLFSLVLALMPDQPLVQTILIFCMSILMFGFLLVQRPFKSFVNLLQHIAGEIIFLIVNTCVLVMAQLNFEDKDSYEVRDRLCDTVIYTSLVFSFIPQVFLGIKLIVTVIEWYKTSRNKTSLNSKGTHKLRIKNRPQKDTVPSLNYPNESLNESSLVGLTTIQNGSSVIMQTRDSSLMNIPNQRSPSSKLRGRELQYSNNTLQGINDNNQVQKSVFRRRSKNTRIKF